MDQLRKLTSRRGASLIELLVAIAVAAVFLPALATGLIYSRSGKVQEETRVDAVATLRQTEEALRQVRESGWANFATDGTFHATISGSKWVLAAGPTTKDSLTIQAVISSVNRNSSGAIVTTGGVVDPSTKKVVVTASWNKPIASKVESTLYMTRYLDNLSHTETSEAQFDLGTQTSVNVTNISGGEVELSTGGAGSWCEPNLSINALDMPKSGVANAISAIEGRAFVGTGDNASGVSFANVNIANTMPPTANIVGTFDGFKTNAVFGETNYAYLATDNNSKEVTIVNLTSNPYSESGYFNAPFNQDGNGVFVVGNVGYVTTGNAFYSFDLSSKNGSRPRLDGLLVTILGTARKVFIRGNYAYIAVDGYAFKELAIVDISNPSNLREVGQADVNSVGGKEVYVNESGTRAYLATSADNGKREFFVIDVSSKNGNRPVVGSYEANGMSPKGVTVVTGNKAILVGTGGEEYQVIDISTDSNPVKCGGLDVSTGINGVSSVLEADGNAFSYIITGDAEAEFKIIEGGSGGQYASSGTFESETFDTSNSTAFNRFLANVAVPNETSLNMQVAVASISAGAQNCDSAVFDFVGPLGSSSASFASFGSSISGVIPFGNFEANYKNPGRCFRYKAFFSTNDNSQTPVIYDVTTNYSP